MKKVNKDFYTFLPKYLQRDLDKKIELYSEEEWFEDAWNKYREHCWEADKKHMESPNLFFGKLVDSNVKNNEEPEPIVLNDIFVNEQTDKELNLELDEPFKMPEEKELEIEKESKEEHEEPV